MNPDLLTNKQAAAFLAVPLRTLDAWRMAGLGPPFVRLGPRQVRYRRTDLEQWLESRTVRPAGGL